jgi:hypothetical protein
MAEQPKDYDIHFVQMVMSLHAAAMQQMGKTMSPLSGKLERDLGMAKQTIDMLDMLKRKTIGNLSDEEQSLVDRLLYEARMNFIDESKKGDSETAEAGEGSESAATTESEPEETDTPKPEESDQKPPESV